jgi:hypothetical protein
MPRVNAAQDKSIDFFAQWIFFLAGKKNRSEVGPLPTRSAARKFSRIERAVRPT